MSAAWLDLRAAAVTAWPGCAAAGASAGRRSTGIWPPRTGRMRPGGVGALKA